MNVVGLGQAGCAIANEFEKYSQYNVYYVDQGLKSDENSFRIVKRASHEEYDSKQLRMTKFVNKMAPSDECLFIMAGSGDVSGASLQVLKFLKKRFNVSLLYIKPDCEIIGKSAYLKDRICYNVLQEYTRSGVFENICVISNSHVEEILEETLTAENYFSQINEIVCYAYHMLNVFKRTEPVLDNLVENGESERIFTIGLVDFESGQEKMFFPLDNPQNKCYYYAISNEEIKNNYKILKKVNKQVRSSLGGNNEPSYQIHSTSYDTNYAFAEFWTSKIQEYPEGV